MSVLTPYTLHPTPCTLHPAPCTLHPTPYTLHYTLHPTPYILHPTPYTLHPAPYTLHPALCTLHPAPCTLHPRTCGSLDLIISNFLRPTPHVLYMRHALLHACYLPRCTLFYLQPSLSLSLSLSRSLSLSLSVRARVCACVYSLSLFRSLSSCILRPNPYTLNPKARRKETHTPLSPLILNPKLTPKPEPAQNGHCNT